MKYSNYSAVIIGSGVAGLYAAIKLSESMNLPDGVLLITKSALNESNTRYAQGGIVGVMHENTEDSVNLHIQDTLKAGAGLSDYNVTKFISENSDYAIKDLLKYGVDFDKDENDNLKFTLEGAHSIKRILHAGGDATGFHIEKALVKKVLSNSDIAIYEHTLSVQLLLNSHNECVGLVAYNEQEDTYETIYSSAVILASGGAGQVFKYTTNPTVTTGDGIALAYNAGAEIQDMEFVQFHPTALALDIDENRFLISEAVRGEGAKLVDKNGNQFMHNYHPDLELAARDIVTRAIYNEMSEHNEQNMYLDATKLDATLLAKRFPNISKICLENGIDITKDYIPVAPAAHYLMGGVKTTVEGRTSIKGLYAIGEVACTSLHGANRLASNSLLECVVCANELANHLSFRNLQVSNVIDRRVLQTVNLYKSNDVYFDVDTQSMKKQIQNIMWDCVGIIRDENSLSTAKNKIYELKRIFGYENKCSTKEEYEVRNLLTISCLMINAALQRKESRGAHYRKDYPQTFENAEHFVLKKEEIKKEDYVTA